MNQNQLKLLKSIPYKYYVKYKFIVFVILKLPYLIL